MRAEFRADDARSEIGRYAVELGTVEKRHVETELLLSLLLLRKEIELALVSPAQLIGEEHGIVKVIRDTFANSWAGFLWSIEKLFVGISLAGPWIVLLAAGVLVWRRARKKKAAQPTA